MITAPILREQVDVGRVGDEHLSLGLIASRGRTRWSPDFPSSALSSLVMAIIDGVGISSQ